MRNRVAVISLCAGAWLLAACPHLPDATVGYYLTKTKVGFRVVRTVACDGNNFLIISNAVTPAVTPVADRTKRRTVTLAKLKGTLSDSDLKFDLYDDGRLSWM
jgi:hypothetical protein